MLKVLDESLLYGYKWKELDSKIISSYNKK